MQRRFNSRMLVLVAAAGLPLLWYGYVLANQLIYHGIKPHNGWTEVDLRTLGYFPFSPDTGGLQNVPARFLALDGKRVELEGVMFATDAASAEVDHFQLVYNLQTCCFSGKPQVQERVFARCAKGKRVTFYENTPMRLTGILHTNVERDKDGYVTAVYELDVETIDRL